MNTFLGKASFLAPSTDVNASSATFVGQAHFNGCIAFSNWLRRDVQALLPDTLELAPNISATPDVHPVAFIFGEQTQGATLFAGITLPMGIRYFECGVAIPFVNHKGGHRLYNYIPRMYSGYFPAVWHGNTYYGFGKQMAQMWWQGPMFLTTAENGVLLLHAVVERDAKWHPGATCVLPNFEAIQDIFALPVVGRRADDVHVYSYFDWDFTEASVRAVDSYVSIDATLLEGLTPRLCHDVASGSFEVRGMKWKLSWPSSCRFS